MYPIFQTNSQILTDKAYTSWPSAKHKHTYTLKHARTLISSFVHTPTHKLLFSFFNNANRKGNFKVILCSYLILKIMNKHITDS